MVNHIYFPKWVLNIVLSMVTISNINILLFPNDSNSTSGSSSSSSNDRSNSSNNNGNNGNSDNNEIINEIINDIYNEAIDEGVNEVANEVLNEGNVNAIADENAYGDSEAQPSGPPPEAIYEQVIYPVEEYGDENCLEHLVRVIQRAIEGGGEDEDEDQNQNQNQDQDQDE